MRRTYPIQEQRLVIEYIMFAFLLEVSADTVILPFLLVPKGSWNRGNE